LHQNGRKIKIELFDAVLWCGKNGVPPRKELENRFRIRVSGKWITLNPEAGRYQFLTLWEFRDKFFHSLKRMIEEGRKS